MNHHQSSKHIADIDIHVYATSAAFVNVIHFGIIPTRCLSVTQHFYGMIWLQLSDHCLWTMKRCGKERAGNMNALCDRMAKNDALWENILPTEVKSHIFETFREKLIYMRILFYTFTFY